MRQTARRMLAALLLDALIASSLPALGMPEQDENAGARYRRGLELMNGGRLEEARREFLELLRLDPGRADIHNILGSIDDRMERTDEAIRHYLRAAELDPSAPGTFNNLGIAYLRKDEPLRAAEYFQRALELDPENISAHYNLGLLRLKERNYPEAISHLEFARAKAPGDLGILYNLARARLENGEAEACLRLFDGVPRNGPIGDVPEIQVLLGAAYAQVSLLEDAALHFETAVRLRPEDPDPYYRLGLIYQKMESWSRSKDALEAGIARRKSPPAEYFLALGEAYRKLGMGKEALNAFRTSLEKEDAPLARIALGSELLDQGQYDLAAAEFERVLRRHPESSDAAVNLALALHRSGRDREALERLRSLEANPVAQENPLYFQVRSGALARLGEWAPALEALRSASRLEPTADAVYFRMGLLLINAGAIRDAVDLFSRVAEKYPDSPTIHVGLAQAYIAGDRLELAEEHLQKSIQLSPEYDEPYYLLGNCYQDRNNYDRAVELYREAISRDPARADFRFSLGLALLRGGKSDEALAQFQKSFEIAPSAETLYRIGSIHLERGDPRMAEDALKKALQVDPNHPESHYLLFRIYSREGKKEAADNEAAIFESLKRREEAGRRKPDVSSLKSVDYYLSFLGKSR